MNDFEAQKALNSLLEASIVEQRRARRWRIFFRIVALSIFLFILIPIMSFEKTAVKFHSHVGVIEIDGLISNKGKSSYDEVSKALKRMYKVDGLKGVILDINSQGGYPAQAHLIYDEIRRQKALHPDIPVYAAISDVGASAAYFIAAAADEIVAAPSSVVGSIGVISFSFGAVDAIKKLGIESRTQAAGEFKDMLDPFQPLTDKDKAIRQKLLDTVHQQFITAVKLGRGDRLKDDPVIFSGLHWTGEEALELGLIDRISSRDTLAREDIGVEDLVYYNRKRDLFDSVVQSLPNHTESMLTIFGPQLPLM